MPTVKVIYSKIVILRCLSVKILTDPQHDTKTQSDPFSSCLRITPYAHDKDYERQKDECENDNEL
jgi:hypothetical protein